MFSFVFIPLIRRVKGYTRLLKKYVTGRRKQKFRVYYIRRKVLQVEGSVSDPLVEGSVSDPIKCIN